MQIGGLGRDRLHGDQGDDLLLGAITAFDRNLVALGDIVREWSSKRTPQIRRANLTDGSGSQSRLNGDTFLNADTLSDGRCDRPGLRRLADRSCPFRPIGDLGLRSGA